MSWSSDDAIVEGPDGLAMYVPIEGLPLAPAVVPVVKTGTVAWLIERLRACPQDAEVYVYSDGYEIGSSARLREIEVQSAGAMVMLSGDDRR